VKKIEDYRKPITHLFRCIIILPTNLQILLAVGKYSLRRPQEAVVFYDLSERFATLYV